jgi:hypothetical protein
MVRFFYVELLSPVRIWFGFELHIITLFHLVITR